VISIVAHPGIILAPLLGRLAMDRGTAVDAGARI
jgi:hypothetical protein